MALYSLSVIPAVRRSGRWVRARAKRPRHIDMGVAGMMLDTTRRLSKVLGRKVDSRLEGGGLLLSPEQLRAFFLSAKTPNQTLVVWASRRGDKERFFLYSCEE